MKNLTLEKITNACHGTYHGDPKNLPLEAVSVVTDSRQVEPGDLFVAIDGERVDGHKFIPETIEKGALCVVSQEDLGEVDYPYIQVDSTVQALLDIARLYRESFDLKVVGISGSVGKTTTKEVISSILSQKYNVHKTAGNFNNHIGLPLSIFGLNEEHEAAVFEMGVNHFGEMRMLSSVVQPDICVLTNIGVAHLEHFGTREGIFKEKSQMILDMKEGGTILLNGDDEILSKSGEIDGVMPKFFGLGENCEFRATNVKSLGVNGTSLTIHLPDGQSFSALIPLPGRHMVDDVLAGAAVGYLLDLSPEQIRAGIESLTSLPGRNHLIKTDRLTILDDCYNANPVSMKAALDVLSETKGRKVAILGDMGELGEEEAALHYETGAYAAEKQIDLVCGVGPLSKELVKGAATGKNTSTCWAETTDAFIEQIPELIHPGDQILVKASHAMHFTDIVEALTSF